ncbi:hypothetical protein F511_38575 [Dorcoceras hygrometricum]|uniref:Uncharacterized protein n=1 Tax=Dorcoceras hygrometricum TaxID=472368 RepID=A0A2Z7C6U0_9LAMI|nr:hypothetical protein F511_38575 [Dorcoceras hygrometricum]
MKFRVVRTNQYNQDLRLIHSTNGNHLESPKEGSSIDHQIGGAGFSWRNSLDCYQLQVGFVGVENIVSAVELEPFCRSETRQLFSFLELLGKSFFSVLRSVLVVNTCVGVWNLSRVLPCVGPKKSNAIIGVVTIGFECLPPSYNGLMGSEDHGPMISPVDTPCGCVGPEKFNAIIGVVTIGFECLPPSYDGLTDSEDHGPMISPVDTPCGYRGSLR